MNKKNYYTKTTYIFSIIVSIVCLFLFFLGSYIFQLQKANYNTVVRTSFEENYRSTETKIEIFKNISKLSFKSEAVKEYGEKTYLNKYYSYLLVKQHLADYGETLVPLYATMAITDFKDEVISTSGILSVSEYLQDFPITEGIWETATENGVLVDESPLYYTFIFKHRYTSENVLYCVINAEKKLFLPTDTNGVLEISDKSADSSFKSKKLAKTFSHLDKDSSWYDSSENGVFVRSSYHIKNMVYLYETLQAKTHYYFFFLFLAICVILLMAWKKIVEWLSGIFYKPLHNVFDMLGYSEDSGNLELLGNSVNKLIQDNRSLRTNLSQSNFDLKSLFIKNLLHGIIPGNKFDAYAKKLNMTHLDSDCICIIIDCYNNEFDNSIENVGETNKLQNKYSEILEKVLTDNLIGELVTIDKLKFAFITSNVSKSLLTNNLLTLQDLFNNYIGFYPFVAVGRTVDSVKNVYESFDDASKIITRKFNFTDSFLVFFDDLSVNETTYYYPIELESTFIESILYGKTEKANEVVLELIDTNLYNLSLSEENLNEFIFSIIATVKRIVYMLNKTTDEIFGGDDILHIDTGSSSTTEKIAESIRSMVNRLIEFTTENLKASHHKLISDILDYIANNYNRDISLDDVAEHFCRSSSHITRILNQDAGVSFKEYLNKTRIEEAKKQLINSNITIEKISENVGYVNTRTFFRVFKKYTGYSPAEYRKTSRNNTTE